MPLHLCIGALVSAFVITFFFTPWAIKLAYKLGAIDQPDTRKVHSKAMPRMGGLAFFAAFLICMVFIIKVSGPFLGLIYGACIVFLAGMIDDIFQISPWLKLCGQVIAAAVAVYFGVVVQFVTNPFDGLLNLGILSIPVTLLWIVGISNAINLIDGLDGLAAGVSVIAAVTMGVVAMVQGEPVVSLAAFILVASILGFLPYNFYPAKTFMGDGGSNFLGFVLACLAIMGTAKSAALISLFIPVIILGIPIFDTFFAIIRRINNKAPIFMPDKNHLHHRLLALGMSHRRSVVLIYAISSFFAAVAIALTFVTSPKAMLVLAFLLILILVMGADKIGMLTGGTGTIKSRGVKTGEISEAESHSVGS